MDTFFKTAEGRISAFLAFLIALNFLFFFAPLSKSLALFVLPVTLDPSYFLFSFGILGVLAIGNIAYFSETYEWKRILGKLLATFFPGAIVLSYGLYEVKYVPYILEVAIGIYLILAGILISAHYITDEHAKRDTSIQKYSWRDWVREQGFPALFFVLFLTGVFFSSGLYRLTEFAAVDEPLWLENRIEKYWKNIGERDWKGTQISDKPGITVALASGFGLLSKDPDNFDSIKYGGEIYSNGSDIQSFYFAFRFPLLVVITLFLPFFYFFLERITGKTAALTSYAFLATSPVLIGMSKIINPDALLWIFVPLALLAFVLYQKKKLFRYLALAGIFLGLGLLTKYVANILLVFLLALLFVEYLYHEKASQKPVTEYFKDSLKELAFLLFVALATFYTLLPAVWLKPEKLFTATLGSQAFEKVAPLFLVLVAFVFLDQWINKSRITTVIMEGLSWAKVSLARLIGVFFLGTALFSLANVWAGMRPYDFMALLEAPKTIATRSDLFGIFLTNFYPLVFGLPPLSLLGFLLVPLFFWKKDFYRSDRLRLAFYLVIFIILYYLGSAVNGVASIVRYQIILFPLAAILAGIAFAEIQTFLKNRLPSKRAWVTPIFLAALSLAGILTILKTPFPLSYASVLLPKQYYTDLKDMGPGSYEIAQKLNALPNARNLSIWTDKDGVCKFFLGRCRRGFGPETIRDHTVDYVVVSSARESRSKKLIRSKVESGDPTVINVGSYYDRDDADFAVLINGRTSHFVKAFAFEGKEVIDLDSLLPPLPEEKETSEPSDE